MHPIHITVARAAASTAAVLPTVDPENIKDAAPLVALNDFAAVFISIADPVHPTLDEAPDGATLQDDVPTGTPIKDVTETHPKADVAVRTNDPIGTARLSGDVQFAAKGAISAIENPAEPDRHTPPVRHATVPPDPDRSAPLPHQVTAPEPRDPTFSSDRFESVSQARRSVAAEGMPRVFPQAAEIRTHPSQGMAPGVDPARALPVIHPGQGTELFQNAPPKQQVTGQAPTETDPSDLTMTRKTVPDMMVGVRAMQQPVVPPPPQNTLGDAPKRTVEVVEIPHILIPPTPKIEQTAPRIEGHPVARMVGPDLPRLRPDIAADHHLSPRPRESAAWDGSADTTPRRGLAPEMRPLQKPQGPLFAGQGPAVSQKLTGVDRLDPWAGDLMPDHEITLRGSTEVSKPGVQPIPLAGHQNTPMAQHVARQIAETLQQMPNRPVEITLNPQELGRVRLSLSSSEAGIVVHLLAERPETMDLMRRQISDLQSAFQDIGYRDIRFSFSDQRQSGTEGNDPDRNTGTGAKELVHGTPEHSTEITLSTVPVTGLDIRL